MSRAELLRELGYALHSHLSASAPILIPPLCIVPAGPFLMGSDPARDHEAQAEELPQHIVTLPTYRIARYPVTVAEYAVALDAHAPALQAPVDWDRQRIHPTRPISGLTWYDALGYVKWLSAVTGVRWRLPTEAEWEKAARGTDGRVYPWGDRWDSRCANALVSALDSAEAEQPERRTTTPVNGHPSGESPYGLLDMVGNVSEWTGTIYEPERFPYPYRLDDGRDDTATDARLRAVRGGCWLWPPERLRAARRDFFHTTDRFDWLIGLRMVLDIAAV